MSWYKANSGGRSDLMLAINNNCIERLPVYLNSLFEAAAKHGDVPNAIVYCDVDDLLVNDQVAELAEELRKHLDREKSDKGFYHHYHKLYAYVFDKLNILNSTDKSLFEIGLGTNNPDMPSTMGEKGRPGASLRAFGAFMPEVEIRGGDIDATISVEGFKTYVIDQLNPNSFQIVSDEMPGGFDIIVDDGLHSPEANFNTVARALTMIKNPGVIVVEDVPTRAIKMWQGVGRFLATCNLSVKIVSCRPDGSNCILIGVGTNV